MTRKRGKLLALAAVFVLLVSCARPNAPAWTVTHDPNGLGYWAGPVGEEPRFYPSAYSNPTVNQAGGPAR